MELRFSYEDGSKAIAHYGTPGMKWGSRKAYVAKGRPLSARFAVAPSGGSSKGNSSSLKSIGSAVGAPTGPKSIGSAVGLKRMSAKNANKLIDIGFALKVKKKLANRKASGYTLGQARPSKFQRETKAEVKIESSPVNRMNTGLSSSNSASGKKAKYKMYRRRS